MELRIIDAVIIGGSPEDVTLDDKRLGVVESSVGAELGERQSGGAS